MNKRRIKTRRKHKGKAGVKKIKGAQGVDKDSRWKTRDQRKRRQ